MLGNREKKNVKKNVNFLKENKRYNNVTYRAQYLVDKFTKLGCTDANNCYYFFIKCFNNLSEETIWSLFENATRNPKINSPIKYFIGACRNQMR